MKQIIPLILILSVIFISCSNYSNNEAVGYEQQDASKIEADAYLYDARIKREGKFNTFRLELFQTDSMIYLGGRGYLGKGALKGRMSSDTILVYFPTADEYLYESIGSLFDSLECRLLPEDFSLFTLFEELPDKMLLDANIEFYRSGDDKRPKYNISFVNCPWKIELVYSKKKGEYKIKHFIFENGNNSMLKAELREFRSDAKIKPSRFQVPDLSRSIKIIP